MSDTTSEWTTGQVPGYRTKTIQRGPCTLIVHRPELTEQEQQKREAQVRDILSNSMREYIRRKDSVAV